MNSLGFGEFQEVNRSLPKHNPPISQILSDIFHYTIIRIKDYHCFLELFFGKDEKCKKEELGFKILKE
jgi:hypothetical protein